MESFLGNIGWILACVQAPLTLGVVGQFFGWWKLPGARRGS